MAWYPNLQAYIYTRMYEYVFIKTANSDFWVDETEWNGQV